MHTTRGDMASMQPAHNPAASDEFLAGVRSRGQAPTVAQPQSCEQFIFGLSRANLSMVIERYPVGSLD